MNPLDSFDLMVIYLTGMKPPALPKLAGRTHLLQPITTAEDDDEFALAWEQGRERAFPPFPLHEKGSGQTYHIKCSSDAFMADPSDFKGPALTRLSAASLLSSASTSATKGQL